jgi:hypothetical protein
MSLQLPIVAVVARTTVGVSGNGGATTVRFCWAAAGYPEQSLLAEAEAAISPEQLDLSIDG